MTAPRLYSLDTLEDYAEAGYLVLDVDHYITGTPVVMVSQAGDLFPVDMRRLVVVP